ncbi:MAG: hypothetical protein J6K42_03990 [Clostridia bacterium]|nr:hypothetical protein [Clostridia bacterium]
MEEKIFYKNNEYFLCGILNKLPKLFVHGSEDSAVPYKLSKIVSDNCENSKFILIKNGEHTFQNSKEALEEAIITSLNFVKQII